MRLCKKREPRPPLSCNAAKVSQLGDEALQRDIWRAWPKIARLHHLKLAGLAVPAGFVVEPGISAVALEAARRRLCSAPEGVVAKLIARQALAGEDGEDASYCGLGRSIADIDSPDLLLQIVRRLSLPPDDEALRTYTRQRSAKSPAPSPRILVQQQIERRWLVVAIVGHDSHPYIETHDATRPEALAEGSNPNYRGPLGTWHDTARAQVAGAIAGCLSAFSDANDKVGYDLELIVDFADRAWVVQIRPLTAKSSLHAGQFFAQLRNEEAEKPHEHGHASIPEGTFILDAEHNPRPLSPAHAWLMHELGRLRPKRSGDPRVLAGWLYMRRLPRQLGSSTQTRAEGQPPPSALAALEELRRVHLPQFRARLGHFERALQQIDRSGLACEIDAAMSIFIDMIDIYVTRIAPARNAHRRNFDQVTLSNAPLTLWERDRYLDVLPVEWDIASPYLSEIRTSASASASASLPRAPLEAHDEATAAALLGELDDHLFALGMAPLRRLWLRAAGLTALDLDETAIFLVDGDELRAFSAGRHWLDDDRQTQDLLRARKNRQEQRRALHPPPCLFDGRAVAAAPARIDRGVGVGTAVRGRVSHRADIRAMCTRPPNLDEIVVLPNLTAQSSVVLAEHEVAGVITAYGGAASHGALMARELGINAIIGWYGALELEEGVEVELDPVAGVVRAVIKPD